MVLLAVLVGSLVWSLVPPVRSLHARIPGLAQRGSGGRRTGLSVAGWVENGRIRAVLCSVGCGLASAAVLGGPWVVAGGLAGLGLSVLLGRLEPAGVGHRRDQINRDLPLTVDLLAACARAGRPVDRAVGVVGRSVGGPIAERFAELEAHLQLGADPVGEWRRLGDDPHFASLSRTICRSLESGAPVVEGLERLATDRRREQRLRSQLRARSVGVRSAAPLAGCFLPAFMLIGVVPTVAGAFLHFVL